jgi:hypothetical protein
MDVESELRCFVASESDHRRKRPIRIMQMQKRTNPTNDENIWGGFERLGPRVCNVSRIIIPDYPKRNNIPCWGVQWQYACKDLARIYVFLLNANVLFCLEGF